MSQFNQILVTLDNLLKLVNNANGRDKATKVLQYSTRIVDDAMSSTQNPNLEVIKRVRLFGTGLATARKVMRFWKPLTGYLALIRFIQRLIRLSQGSGKEKQLKLIEVLQLIEKVFVANYFLLDHLNWAAKTGLLSNEKLTDGKSSDNSLVPSGGGYELKSLFNNGKAARYGQIGFTFWMYGVLAGVIATSMELVNSVNREAALLSEMNANLKELQVSHEESFDANSRAKELEQQMVKLTNERNALIRKEIVGLCDLGTAAALSGHWQAKNWLVGVLGVVSAGIGVYEMWP